MTIEKLKEFYQQRATKTSQEIKQIKKKINLMSTVRLSVVLIAAFLVYLFWNDTPYIIGVVGVALVVMLVLVKKHAVLFQKRDFWVMSKQDTEHELASIDYDFSPYDGAKEHINPTHSFSLDIDLFGERSLFQSINRTTTPDGKNCLAAWFKHPLTTSTDILARQAAIQELQVQDELRHQFRVTGLLSPATNKDMQELRSFVQEPYLFLSRKMFWKTLAWAYPLAWAAIITLVSVGILPPSSIIWCIVIMFGFAESKKKQIDRLQRSLEKKMKIISSLAELTRLIEGNEAKAPVLQTIQQQLQSGQKPVSTQIASLSSLLSNLDQRSGALGRLVLNTLLLWDIRYATKIEIWKEEHGKNLNRWMQAVGQYDALCSLATYATNHPGYLYPEPSETYFQLEAEGIGHPLMRRDVCVRNDINIDGCPFFMIITGANMAGKSTYLRTIGVNYLLATVGAPVCAKSFRFYPAQLVTSLRTSDSLSDNESYFFAELKRLKMIIDRLKQGEQMFIILDEILKGTNSVDKQKGSFALMRQLLAMNACGIIATHDLALGNLLQDFPENIRNYRFEADIQNDELTFSYSLQPGVAENMNACFLMNKMGITID